MFKTVVGSARKRERGQALTEFALVLPLFILVMFAIAEIGWATRTYLITMNASREGARVAAVSSTTSDAVERAVDVSGGMIRADEVAVVNHGSTAGQLVTVEVSYDYNYITPVGHLVSRIAGKTIPSPLKMTSATKMRIE